MMQLDLDQPQGQQPGGRERSRIPEPHRELPGVIGQLPADGAQGHRRGGQVGREFLRAEACGVLDGGRPLLLAGVGGAVLAGPCPDQQVAHRVGAPGQVREDVSPRPAWQQRRPPQLRVGDLACRAEQALRRVVDLVTQLALRGVHLLTLKRQRPRPLTCGAAPDRRGQAGRPPSPLREISEPS